MRNSEELFNEACRLMDGIDEVGSNTEAWRIVDALRLLVKANRKETAPSLLKARIILQMAYCNRMLGDNLLVYNCALIAKVEFFKAVERMLPEVPNAVPPDDEKSCDELINLVCDRFPESVRLLDDTYALTKVNTAIVRKRFPLCDMASFSRELILGIAGRLSKLASDCYYKALKDANWERAQRKANIITSYRAPLLYIWEKYGFGPKDDIWEEAELMTQYLEFEDDAELMTPKIIETLKTSSPFNVYDDGDRITEGLILIMTDFQEKLNARMLS